MAVTQQQLALQMLAQLRVLDPSVSAEVGTPERKILDTVAQALSDSQVDLTQLSGALDVDSKFGTNLDHFLALFGFGRQQAVRAQGFIDFRRDVASDIDIRIPAGSQIQLPIGTDSPVDQFGNPTAPVYEVTLEATLLAGETSVSVPVRAIIAGAASNLEAGKNLQPVGAPVYGITEWYNVASITGGVDQEDDDQLKTRFKNTVFRNLAGTQDQFMALAASTAYTTKVNVVGPISRYREYIQVPSYDDAGYLSGVLDPAQTAGGAITEWTSALSTIPYSKHIYDNVPNFISNGQTGTRTIFYRQETDWRLNTGPLGKNRGDTYRLASEDDPLDATNAEFRPNVTFLNVYSGTDDSVVAVRPRDIVLFEHSYMSTASRNSYENNVTNAVDVFIDGGNYETADTVVPSPGILTTTAFTNDEASPYYVENYRRWNQPDTKPSVGNLLIPLFWQPVTSIPEEITITTNSASSTFFLNEHYWFVEEVTDLYGTIRARNGLEWIPYVNGALSSTDTGRTGNTLADFPIGTPIPINGYGYDRNIIDLQSTIEAQKQVTTDILVHRARTRYFKLDITVMYSGGTNNLQVDEDIRSAVQRYFNTQYFGSVIQLSDLLSVIHNVSGVDNVRWSSDVPGGPDTSRVFETNVYGTTRSTPTILTDPLTYDNDFFLYDDELPSLATTVDTVGFNGGTSDTASAAQRQFSVQPGLIIRSRAQNTWIKS